ncbi:MAG: tetratricopeptide repeat protein [Acidobacteria bacterium]|nr:tetratricopeptide repeat protein [Acidobacteriota bacterium]
MKRNSLQLFLIALLMIAAPSRGQEKTPPQGQEQPPPENPGQLALKCEKAMEIGNFYYNKKNYDAAIDRYREAANYRPNFAKPHFLLGQAFEKKGDSTSAITEFKKYLELWPKAPDAEKVQRRITEIKESKDRETAPKKSTD